MMKFILALVPLISFSQNDWEKVEPKVFVEVLRTFEKTIAKGDSYSFDTYYSIFNNYMDLMPIKQFSGSLICKSGEELNVRQMGQLSIQNSEINLTVDSVSKQLIVQKSDSSFFYRKTVEDYLKFSEIAESIFKKKQGEQEIYILEFIKGFPYKSMEISVAIQGDITQVVIYSNHPYLVDNIDYSNDRAKIIMDIKDFRKGKSVDLNGFLSIEHFINKENEKMLPAKKYSNYELIDLRD